MARIGILGGTFNPPHLGHLACARAAREQLGLDRIVLMPVATPPHKEAPDDPGGQVRVELCRSLIAGEDGVVVSALEVERGGTSYTVDTLRALDARDPGNELTFIVGGDAAIALPTWREPEAVLDLATLAVVQRDGLGRDDVLPALAEVPGSADRVVFFDMPPVDVSSSAVRERVAAGSPVDDLVGGGVAREIARRGLYRQGGEGIPDGQPEVHQQEDHSR